MSARSSFSLVEILIVVAIMGTLFGLAFSASRSDTREALVRGAAEELAAAMRETRTRAMRNNTVQAIAFNICNAPGSSGKILNNRSGGHWYRVLGPRENRMDGLDDLHFGGLPLLNGYAPLNNKDLSGGPVPLRQYLQLVAHAWTDAPRVLPKGRVRFLALTDQDNGNNNRPGHGGWYSPTYPRPWFGWWDATQGLHTWGGYDSTLAGDNQATGGQDLAYSRGGHVASPSGFYYEGWDGPITGCLNPVDKVVLDDVEGGANPGALNMTDVAAGATWIAWRAGEPRALINADWLDFILVFRPDGTVSDDWFRLRNHYRNVYRGAYNTGTVNIDSYLTSYGPPDWARTGYPSNGLNPSDAGPGDRAADRASGLTPWINWNDLRAPEPRLSRSMREATSYVDRTGYFWITLAADAADDRVQFPTALEALRSLLPLYRVGISLDGHVRVIRVNTTWKNCAGKTFDSTLSGAGWQDKNRIWGKAGATWNDVAPFTGANYLNHMLNTKDLLPLGSPVYDTVLPEMLAERKWWWQ